MNRATHCSIGIGALAAALLASSAGAQPANDSCSNPESISGYGTFNFDTGGADTDGPATFCAAGTAYNDIWYCWTATASGNTRIALCGTGHDTVLAVYDGCGCPGGGETHCNDDSACGLASTIDFDATAGAQYTIRIGSYSDGDTGPGVMTISEFIPGVVYGPVISPINGHTYYLLENSSWHDAESNAVALGGHLATIRSQEENDWVFSSVLQFDGNIRRGWLGITDEGDQGNYRWTSGEPVNYTNWLAGEPNHSNGTEFYGQFVWWTAGWNDNSDFPGDDPSYPIVEVAGCAADFNGDGFLDFFDFSAFVDCFEGVECPAGRTGDYNGDGFPDFFDFADFVGDFEAGC